MEKVKFNITRNYLNLFFKQVQRPVNYARIKHLKECIQKYGYFLHEPIIINCEGEVLDGQHRIAALKELYKEGKDYKISIIEVSNSSVDISDIAMLAQTKLRKSWTFSDYLHYHSMSGKNEYLRFNTFLDAYKLSITVGMLLCGKPYGKKDADIFKEGSFICKDWDKANKYAKDICELYNYWQHAKLRNFVMALLKFMNYDDFDFKQLIHNYNSNRSLLYRVSTVSQYCELINKTYNYRKHDKIDFRRRFAF